MHLAVLPVLVKAVPCLKAIPFLVSFRTAIFSQLLSVIKWQKSHWNKLLVAKCSMSRNDPCGGCVLQALHFWELPMLCPVAAQSRGLHGGSRVPVCAPALCLCSLPWSLLGELRRMKVHNQFFPWTAPYFVWFQHSSLKSPKMINLISEVINQ